MYGLECSSHLYLRGSVDLPEGKGGLQADLDRMNGMSFSEDEWQFLRFGRNNLMVEMGG